MRKIGVLIKNQSSDMRGEWSKKFENPKKAERRITLREPKGLQPRAHPPLHPSRTLTSPLLVLPRGGDPATVQVAAGAHPLQPLADGREEASVSVWAIQLRRRVSRQGNCCRLGKAPSRIAV